MSKNHKRITRAMKIEASLMAKRREAAEKFALAQARADNPVNVAKAKELLLRIESDKAIMEAASQCECDFDCRCSRNYGHAEHRIEEAQSILEVFSPVVVDKARKAIQDDKDAAQRYWDERAAAQANQEIDHGDLWDVFEKELPNVKVSDKGYCDRDYTKWENTIAKPALEQAGYKHVEFSSYEEDSFGPLIREVTAVKNNVLYKMYYG